MKNFYTLLRWGVWIVGTFSPFLIPPKIELFQGGSVGQISLSQFIAAIFMALFIALLSRLPQIKWWWLWTVAALSFYGFLTQLFSYQSETDRWIKTYNGGQFVIGRDFQDRVLEKDRTRRPEQLLADFGVRSQADVDQIWTQESIRGNINLLSRLYIFLLGFLTLLVVTVGKILPEVEPPPA